MKKIILVIISLLFICSCTKKESENLNMQVIINNRKYDVVLQDNETAKALIQKLPLELNMQDLNNNEKYAYLDFNLKTSPVKVNEIAKGDIMLFNNNCLVIFYKSFKTTYEYTKIGHINDLEDLDNSNMVIKFL